MPSTDFYKAGVRMATAEAVDSQHNRSTCTMLPINPKVTFFRNEPCVLWIRLPYADDATVQASIFTLDGQYLDTYGVGGGFVPIKTNCSHWDTYINIPISSLPGNVSTFRVELVGFKGKNTRQNRAILEQEKRVSGASERLFVYVDVIEPTSSGPSNPLIPPFIPPIGMPPKEGDSPIGAISGNMAALAIVALALSRKK